MDTVAKYLRLRCFLEGIEVPVIGAVVQMTINFPAVASIQVVPTDQAQDLISGMTVHLFFYDFLEEGVVESTDFKRYKLLFCGQLTGYSYTRAAIGRSAVLQCTDFTSAWQRCYQYMITYGPNGNFITPEASNYAAGSGKLNNIIDGHLAVLGRYLNSRPRSPGLRGMKGLLGGIITLIEQFGGVVGHTRGVNDWFTYTELKYKTMQQIAAEEEDNTAQLLFDAKEFYEWLENGIVSLGELCSVWDMIRLLFQYIYYEASPNTCAYYSKGTEADKFSDTEKINNILKVVSASLYDNKDFTDIKLRSVDSIEKLGIIKSYVGVTKDQIKNTDLAVSTLQKLQEKASYDKTVTKSLATAKKYVDSSIVTLSSVEQKSIKVDRLASVIFKPECYFVAPPRCSVVFPEQNTQINYSRNFLQEYTRLRLQSGMLFNIDSEKLLADFSYAPSGKVVTEYAKKNGFGGGFSSVLPWEKNLGILPKFEYIQEINYVSSKKGKEEQKKIQGVAKFYKQKAANYNFYKYRFMSRQMTGSCRFNPMLVVGFPMVVIDKPFNVDRQKLIDIARRRGVDIDKITSQDIINNIQDFAVELGAPYQFIGYTTNISHSIDQQGATTSFSCTHARPHRTTNDDLLLLLKNSIIDDKKTTVTKRTVLDLDIILKNEDKKALKYLIQLTNQSPPAPGKKGTVKETKPKIKLTGFEVFDSSLRNLPREVTTEFRGPTEDAEFNSSTVRFPKQYGDLQIGNEGPLGTISAIQIVNDLVKQVDFENKKAYAWKTLIVYEDVEEAVKKQLPIEYILSPSWFSPLYSNSSIGKKIYGNFFGCGSVVDELVYSNNGDLSIQAAGKTSNQILDSLSSSTSLQEDVEKLQQENDTDIVSVENAIDILAFQYGEALKLGLDVNKFVNDYTYRPIATMEDILGSEDLEYEQIGNELKTKQGKSGFHSIAVAGIDNLTGLLSDPDLPLPNRTNSETLPRAIDNRKELKESAQKYKDSLNISVGEVIGLQG